VCAGQYAEAAVLKLAFIQVDAHIEHSGWLYIDVKQSL
jgi:hypothetical protein